MPPATAPGQAKEEHELPFAEASSAQARRLLHDFVSQHGVSQRCQQEAMIVLGELVSNALDHGKASRSGCFTVTFTLHVSSLTVAVTDGGSGESPHVVDAGPYAARGRGLAMVQALCADWGVESRQGTSVRGTLNC